MVTAKEAPPGSNNVKKTKSDGHKSDKTEKTDKSEKSNNNEEWRPVVGERVLISKKPATCRFVGQTQFSAGEWIGLELEEPIGKNDGLVQGVRYFQCPPSYGVFTRPNVVNKLTPEEAAKFPAPKAPASPQAAATPEAKKGSVTGAAPPAAGSNQVSKESTTDLAACRAELSQALQDGDTLRLNDLLPRAEAFGLPASELEQAQRVLNQQMQGMLIQEVQDVQTVVAQLAETVAVVEARATNLERAMMMRTGGRRHSESELDRNGLLTNLQTKDNGRKSLLGGPGKGAVADSMSSQMHAAAGATASLLDSTVMEEWLAEFADRLQARVWQAQESGVQQALDRAMERVTQELIGLAAFDPALAMPSKTPEMDDAAVRIQKLQRGKQARKRASTVQREQVQFEMQQLLDGESKQQEEERLRLKTETMLLGAKRSGALDAEMQKRKGMQEEEKLRAKFKSLLISSNDDGSLADLLSKVPPERPGVEEDDEMAQLALKIQSVQRGRMARKSAKQESDIAKHVVEQNRSSAATKIQSLQRGNTTRKRGSLVNEAPKEHEQAAKFILPPGTGGFSYRGPPPACGLEGSLLAVAAISMPALMF